MNDRVFECKLHLESLGHATKGMLVWASCTHHPPPPKPHGGNIELEWMPPFTTSQK